MGLLEGNPTCPKCGRKIDGYTGVTDPQSTPEKGDISVCSYCYAILEFGDGEWSLLSYEVLDEIECNDPKTFKVLTTLVELLRARNGE